MDITVDGYDDFSQYLGRLIDHVQSPRGTLKKAGLMMHTDVTEHFRQEQSPDGKWAQWLNRKGERVSRRPTKRGGSKLLQDTGRLRNSLVIASDDKGAEVGTNLVYAQTHQMGDARRNIVSRQFAWLSDSMLKRIGTMFVDDMRGIS